MSAAYIDPSKVVFAYCDTRFSPTSGVVRLTEDSWLHVAVHRSEEWDDFVRLIRDKGKPFCYWFSDNKVDELVAKAEL